jgi:hypothetical protein
LGLAKRANLDNLLIIVNNGRRWSYVSLFHERVVQQPGVRIAIAPGDYTSLTETPSRTTEKPPDMAAFLVLHQWIIIGNGFSLFHRS